ncbi:AraC family transcriptional regulator [Paenibacillus helianthi]|uniref:AraC family transcriptional regulator n=1 Tax=Paenibacillus helianthi TaxID=1349432 RepID=A0ABX3EW72_9BACL|nr:MULTISPECIES: AraC family transcriptional regulator [Paenibacillus]OKP72284.1 AraC family transcriptional regulator [Paenibacillus sp. P3E]OKP89719.1 AraC family transcriptional regulator [Paenibacillus sp. P32E]OKP90868.1 AraC family transcriptional regulator [Paenibacillus helianthi]
MNSPILHFISPPIPYFVDCGHATYAAGDVHINRNCIGVFDLIVVLKGILPVGEDGKEWKLHEGEILILRPDGHHYGSAPCTEDTKIIWIHFQTFGSWKECMSMDECLESQVTLIESHKQKAYLNHADVCSIYIPKHMKISRKAMEVLDLFFEQEHEPQSLRNWKRQASFQSFLQHLDRDLASPSDATAIQLAEKVELFIRHNYTRDINNPMLQKELNYHPNYLAKSMLKTYGMTPMAYLQNYRVEQSKRLLLQTSWSVTRIAEEVGFHHVSHFSSCFSKKEGLSPSGFRSKFIQKR